MLLTKRVELLPRLRANAFGEPLVLISRELPGRMEGDVYADVAHPFAVVGDAFRSATAICELLFMHLNVRSCTPSSGTEGERLTLVAGSKRSNGFAMQDSISYVMHTEAADATHLRVILSAAQGPLSTTDYLMVFESVPIDAGHSFVHFGYSYAYGTLARMAMASYLATSGRAKIGFTVEGQEVDGRPKYVQGVRGAIERNVMRYYLALQARFSITTGSPDERNQARLRAWFALTERYAAQLHEYDIDEYLREKRRDLARIAAGA
ncbi:MAG: hypothetical protein ACKVOX_10155 [Rhizobacter sp.]